MSISKNRLEHLLAIRERVGPSTRRHEEVRAACRARGETWMSVPPKYMTQEQGEQAIQAYLAMQEGVTAWDKVLEVFQS